jgi:type 1 glutamine amidotransferase
MPRHIFVALLLAAGLAGRGAHGADPIRVMLLDGESGGPWHDWPAVSLAIEQILDEAGIFEVTVVTAPPADGDFSTFDPNFSAFDTIVFNYEAPDARWPQRLKEAFEQYVRDGGGFVSVHAADNAFPGWQAWNEMIGIGGWGERDERAGPYWYFSDGNLVADASAGPTGSHGERLPFLVTLRDTKHPITRGLPATWMHGEDELYAELRGPGRNMTVLASAWSDPDNAGTGRDEPQLIVLTFGEGRIFHTTFGHDVRAMSSVDTAVTLQRGVEWSATGDVTQPIPANFPGSRTPRYDPDVAAVD